MANNDKSLEVTIDYNGDSIYLRDEGSDDLVQVIKLTPNQVGKMKDFFEELFNRMENRVLVLTEVDEDTTTPVDEWDFRVSDVSGPQDVKK